MITLADFFEDQISQCNSWYIDDLLTEYMREKKIPNSEYDKLFSEIIVLISSKPEVQYEKKTGRFMVNTLYVNHSLSEKLENTHSQITGHIIGSLISENFTDFIKDIDIMDSFKQYQIENLFIFDQNIKINLKDEELEYNIDIYKRFFTIKTHYILKNISKSIIPYFEFLNSRNDYQFHRKCHLPLDYGIYSAFLEIQKFFTQKFDKIVFKIDTFDQNQ